MKKHDNEMIQASPKWGKKGVEAVISLAFLLIFQFFDDLFFAFFLKEQGEKGMERRGKIVFLFLLKAFGLFSILPANKSFKQFKRYALVKTLKTNY